MNTTQFLTQLTDDENFTWQIIPEKNKNHPPRILQGSFKEVENTLKKANQSGDGIFFMVNGGDCQGRSASNVTHVRALFVDLDGAPHQELFSCPVEPHFIIESSPGRYHGYWCVEDCPLDEFSDWQKALAVRFDGDIAVHDLPRVMRVPGFLHNKKEPFKTKVISSSISSPYSLSHIVRGLGLEKIKEETKEETSFDRDAALNGTHHGDRHYKLFKLACSCRARNFSKKEAFLVLREACKNCTPPATDDDAVKYINEAFKRYSPKFAEEPEPPKKPKAKIITFAEFDDMDIPNPTPVVINGFDAGNLVAVIGKSKQKKSFFVQGLTLHVAAGLDYLGLEVIIPRPVLYVNFELENHYFRKRLRKQLAGRDDVREMARQNLDLYNLRGEDIHNFTFFEEITDRCKHRGTKLIIIDPFYRLMTGEDENSVQGMGPILRRVEQLASEVEAAVVCVHHDGKGEAGDRDIRDRGAGSSVLSRQVDATFALATHATERDDLVVVETMFRNFKDPEPFTIQFNEETKGFESSTEEAIKKTAIGRPANPKNFIPNEQFFPQIIEHIKSRSSEDAYKVGSKNNTAGTLFGFMMGSLQLGREKACEVFAALQEHAGSHGLEIWNGSRNSKFIRYIGKATVVDYSYEEEEFDFI